MTAKVDLTLTCDQCGATANATAERMFPPPWVEGWREVVITGTPALFFHYCPEHSGGIEQKLKGT